jgi:hypothetical protein
VADGFRTEDAYDEEGEDRCENPEFGEQRPVTPKAITLRLRWLIILMIHFVYVRTGAGRPNAW